MPASLILQATKWRARLTGACTSVLHRYRWAMVALVASALAGCTTLPSLLPQNAAVDFELEGRAAVRYGTEGGSTRIIWRHGFNGDDVQINGPLGQGIARISRNDTLVVLRTAEGQEFRAADAESLTESVLGWRLPLTGLADWVRGRPVANRPARVERDAQGRVSEIFQDEWQINYVAWNEAVPARINLVREGDKGRIELRLVIDRWSATP